VQAVKRVVQEFNVSAHEGVPYDEDDSFLLSDEGELDPNGRLVQMRRALAVAVAPHQSMSTDGKGDAALLRAHCTASFREPATPFEDDGDLADRHAHNDNKSAAIDLDHSVIARLAPIRVNSGVHLRLLRVADERTGRDRVNALTAATKIANAGFVVNNMVQLDSLRGMFGGVYRALVIDAFKAEGLLPLDYVDPRSNAAVSAASTTTTKERKRKRSDGATAVAVDKDLDDLLETSKPMKF
jgi:hypothetical protein